MLKRFLKAISDILWALGAEDLAMTVLLKSYEGNERKVLQTEIGLPENGFRIKTVFVDKQAVDELVCLHPMVNAVCLPRGIEDVN